MRRFVGIVLLIAAAAGFAAAVQARVDDFGGGDSTRWTAGITGQQQSISFALDRNGWPRSLRTLLWELCPGAREQRTDWTPADGAPVAFRRRGDRLTIRERKRSNYDDGTRGVVSVRLEARVRDARVYGIMRAVQVFARDGRETTACDSGNVPFATGPDAEDELGELRAGREPWTLYPTGAEERLSPSSRRLAFARRVDDVCLRTGREARRAILRALARNSAGNVRAWVAYLRSHEAQLAALRALGDPPSGEEAYQRWIDGFARRVELRRREVGLVRRGELRRAAALAARLAALQARGNADALAFGLGHCGSKWPTGGP